MSGKSNTKRICFVTTSPITLKAFVRPQAKILILNGWEVTWVCAEDPNFYHEMPIEVKYIQHRTQPFIVVLQLGLLLLFLFVCMRNGEFVM